MTASVELFQGKEKPVIIVSTVRTGRQGIGFLDSPQVSQALIVLLQSTKLIFLISLQRLNVLLTRAQALMILIGDPNVLQKDQHWYDVLKRLSSLKVIIGAPFVLSKRRPMSTNQSQITRAVSYTDNENKASTAMAALKLI